MKVYLAVVAESSLLFVFIWMFCSCTTAEAATVGKTTQYPRPWKLNEFPNPQTNNNNNRNQCQSSSNHRICDPDLILDSSTFEALSSRMESFESDDTFVTWCLNSNHHNDDDAHVVKKENNDGVSTEDTKHKNNSNNNNDNNLQLAVAIVQSMDLSIVTGSFDDGEKEEEAAKIFATSLHNEWGVGNTVKEEEDSWCGVDGATGGTGILLFLSIDDRTVYISTGSAIGTLLTEKRSTKIIHSMKPLLRRTHYGDAIEQAIHDMTMYIQKGPPDFPEVVGDAFQDLISILLFALFGILWKWSIQRERQSQRDYAHVESQLSQLDRNRAEILQGRYQCTSCPICLEPFQTTAPTPSQSEGGEGSTSNNTSNGNNEVDTPTSNVSAQRMGSDGKPLKLLRCGHVFDESCWSEWVSSGTGNVRRCPICQQDVGGSNNGQNNQDENPVVANNNNNNVLRHRNAVPAEDNEGDERRIRMFRRERNFRLMRMAARYPRYIRPQQLQRWTDDSYDGSLAQDTSFVRNNPTYNTPGHSHHSSTRNSTGGSFGGGSSSGGQGGRW